MSGEQRLLMWKWRMNAALFTVIAVANVLTIAAFPVSVLMGIAIAVSLWAQAIVQTPAFRHPR
jgi:hypothetical protein